MRLRMQGLQSGKWYDGTIGHRRDVIGLASAAYPPRATKCSPPAKKPDLHMLCPAITAARYLGEPARAKLIKALMRGLLGAVIADAPEPLGLVVCQNFAAPSAVRRNPPIFQLRYHAVPAASRAPAGKAVSQLQRGSGESISEREGRKTSDHRVLLVAMIPSKNHAGRISARSSRSVGLFGWRDEGNRTKTRPSSSLREAERPSPSE